MVDLVSLYRPVTKWGDMITLRDAAPEMVRKAFKQAETERPGATFVVLPEDVAERTTDARAAQGERAARSLALRGPGAPRGARARRGARHPVVLAGAGVARDHAVDALRRFSERLNIPVATTFQGKGAIPDDHPNALGTIGFMVKDYANFGFDRADLVVAVGYDIVEYSPVALEPGGGQADHPRPPHGRRGRCATTRSRWACRARSARRSTRSPTPRSSTRSPRRCRRSRTCSPRSGSAGEPMTSFPLAPARIVHDIREAMGRDDIVLCDTGAAKMWMARLYPTYEPNTCLISNGLATMAFALPGAIAAKLVRPDRKVLAVMGDGAFLMSVAELETAVRERVPLIVLVWVDGGYGLIGWKQDLHFGRRSAVAFDNPDFVGLAESFGARGYRIESAEQLLPTLRPGARRRRRQRDRLPRGLRGERAARRAAGGARGLDLRLQGASPRPRVR